MLKTALHPQGGFSLWIFSNLGEVELCKYTKKFDGVDIDDFAVTSEEIDEAFSATSPELISAMKRSAENIRAFHQLQMRTSQADRDPKDFSLGQKIIPLERVALYVPGGRAAYPSSVLMNAIPAKVAGVSEVFIITPPNKYLNQHQS